MTSCNECKKPALSPGYAACAGCSMPLMARAVLHGTPEDTDVVTIVASGCFVVATQIYPLESWNIPMSHLLFETSPSFASGQLAAYNALKRKGRLPQGVYDLTKAYREQLVKEGKVAKDRKIRFVIFAGDGATVDIGLGPLSGLLERGEPIIYVCYDNGAYQNTGTQSSGVTPRHAITATTPKGVLRSAGFGGKDLMAFALAHPALAYAAHSTISTIWPNDITEKAREAFAHEDGPSLLHIISPCPRGWAFPSDSTYAVADIAIETGECPLYHIEKVGRDHIWHLDYLPERYAGGIVHPEVHPITELLASQGRFGELLRHEDWTADFQEEMDHRWVGRGGLIARCEPYGS